MSEELEVIEKYFNLDRKIKGLQNYKRDFSTWFYSQNMTTHLVYDAHGIHSTGFRQDIKILNYLENLEKIDERIKINLLRREYFSEFLGQLSESEQKILKLKFVSNYAINISSEMIDTILDEIKEIEVALKFRYGIEPSFFDMELTNNVSDNLERMRDFFAI